MPRQKGVRYFLDWMLSTKSNFTHAEFMEAFKKAQEIEDENIDHAFMCGSMTDHMGGYTFSEEYKKYAGWWPTFGKDGYYTDFIKEFYH